jgi:hypothetical protein
MTMTRAEGREIDRLSRGEAVESRHSCARPGCWHSHLHHKHRTKGRPCELCGCEGLIRFEEAGTLMDTLAFPLTVFRSWTYVYRPPEAGGWPKILHTGWPEANRSDKLVTAYELRIHIRQGLGEEPALNSIRLNGMWPNGNPVTNMNVHFDPVKRHHELITFAPDWVMELAADAIGRAKGETS